MAIAMPQQQLELTEEERRYYLFLKEQGVLKDIEPERIDQSRGAVLVFCGDGYKSGDIHKFHAELMMCWRGELGPLVHLCAKNGGALTIPSDSPIVRAGSTAAEDLLCDIEEAIENLGIGVVFIVADVPCLKAHKHGLHPPMVLDLITSAKNVIKRRVPNTKVLSCIRISWSPSSHKTYAVPRKAWRDSILARGASRAWTHRACAISAPT